VRTIARYLALALVGVLATPASGATGQPAQPSVQQTRAQVGIQPRLECRQLIRTDFATTPGTPARILSAQDVTPPDGGYPYCLVRGYIAPQIQFELRLPTQTYLGRFLQLGCSRFCGFVTYNPLGATGCRPLDDGTFATAYQNMGHFSMDSTADQELIDPFDGIWAGNDPQLRVDLAYRSDRAVTIVAKAITKTFYGERPSVSYFAGCSQGGRQALNMAQRYPDEFDGVLAGGPAFLMTPLVGEALTWTAVANRDEAGRVILGTDKIPVLSKAVLERCDADDGLVDGQIDDPRGCDFEPASVQCPAGTDRPDCLTPAQVGVAEKFYSGPVDARGRRLYPGGLTKGSEPVWPTFNAPRPNGQSAAESGALNYLKYLGYWENPPASFTLRDHTFDLEGFRRLEQLGDLYNASNPDLSAFRESGGKLILWQYWGDYSVPPQATLNYYDTLRKYVGGEAGRAEFVKLYMLPGNYACSENPAGGPAPGTFDFLTPLINWVEEGTQPDRVVGSRSQGGEPVRTRPVFPYPTVARYDGTGSVDDAANFVAAPPSRPVDDHVPWVGDYLLRPGRALQCEWKDGRNLVCTRS
jgi:pimeloyl-ACP methyl ester carboxylesterase